MGQQDRFFPFLRSLGSLRSHAWLACVLTSPLYAWYNYPPYWGASYTLAHQKQGKLLYHYGRKREKEICRTYHDNFLLSSRNLSGTHIPWLVRHIQIRRMTSISQGKALCLKPVIQLSQAKQDINISQKRLHGLGDFARG